MELIDIYKEFNNNKIFIAHINSCGSECFYKFRKSKDPMYGIEVSPINSKSSIALRMIRKISVEENEWVGFLHYKESIKKVFSNIRLAEPKKLKIKDLLDAD